MGYVRDILIAIFLGTSIFADAFFVAFRLPNTFRRLFAEGTFNAAFIPSYTSAKVEDKKKGKKFANDVCNILQENAEEKMQMQSQEDPEPEETIYTGFASPKDKFLFTKWHEADWKDKLAMLDKFEDNRHAYFGSRILFNEAPEILPKDMYKKIKRKVAERILSTNKEKWTTVNDFYVDCDNLREDDNKMFSFKTKDEKLKFLDGINDYVMNLELKYQDA